MNIDKEKLVIEDNILYIYQQENQNDTLEAVAIKLAQSNGLHISKDVNHNS